MPEPIRYLSLFSGIEAASVAWEPLGFKPDAFAEIEPFPCKVLAHHWPDVPNLGDVTTVDWEKWAGKVDVLVGGSPCQDFSIAGLRAGLDGARGNLMLTYLHIVDTVKPKWLVFENVPGILSDKTHAFEKLLETLQDMGYLLDADILDAQFFDAPQRRERVFVTGVKAKELLAQGTLTSAVVAAQTVMELVADTLTACYRASGHDDGTGDKPLGVTVRHRLSLFGLTDADGLATLMTLAGATTLPAGKDMDTLWATARALADGTMPDGGTAPATIPPLIRVGLTMTAPILAIIRKATGMRPVSRTPFELEETTLDLLERFIAYARQKSEQPSLFDGDGDVLPDLLGEAVEDSQLVRRAVESRRDSGQILPEFESVPWRDLASREKRQTLAARTEKGAARPDRHVGPDDNREVMAFAQNQRDEVRELDVPGALAANPGVKQQTYVKEHATLPFRFHNGMPEPTEGDVSPTLLARAGTGGNQTPMVATGGIMCRADGQANASTDRELAPTLTSHSKKDPPIVYPAQPALFGDEEDTA